MHKLAERGLFCLIWCYIIAHTFGWVGLATEGWGRGRLLRTVDGGRSWIPLVQAYIDLHSVAVPTPFSAVAVGNNGTIIIATPFNHTLLANVSSFNQSYSDSYSGGYLARVGSLHVPESTIWTTPALRFVYAKIHSTILNQLRSVLFVNATIGITVGATGTILRTTNSGLDWYRRPSGIIRDINSFDFINLSPGHWLMMACGNVGTILMSTDTGMTWRLPTIGTNTVENLYDVEIIDSNQAIACGNAGTVIRSTDGGESWSLVTTAAAYSAYSLYSIAYNRNTGVHYISGSQSLMLEYDGSRGFRQLDVASSSPQRLASLFMTPSVQVFGSRSRVYTLNNRTWVGSPDININSISSLAVVEASIMSVYPMVFNLSSYSGFNIDFNLTISNIGTEVLTVYSVHTTDDLITGDFAGGLVLQPGQSSERIHFVYHSADLIAALATYYTNFTFLCDSPVQSAFVEVSILIVPQPEDLSKSFLSQYWWAFALGFAGLLAILFIFARRRMRYIKRYNRRVMYEDEKISFWGCWLFGAHMEHDSDSDFWSDDEEEDLHDEFDDHRNDDDTYEYPDDSKASNSRGSHMKSGRRSILSSFRPSVGSANDSFDEGEVGDEDTDSSISDQEYRDYDYLKHANVGKRLAERRSSSFGGPYRSAHTLNKRHKSMVQR